MAKTSEDKRIQHAWESFKTKTLVEVGEFSKGMSLDELRTAKVRALAYVHQFERINGLLGVAIAVRQDDEDSQFFYLTSLQADSPSQDWLVGRVAPLNDDASRR